MRVVIILKTASTLPQAQLAGAFVLYGFSSREGVEAVQLLQQKDIVVELTGTLAEIKATFAKYGFEVRQVPASPEATPPRLEALSIPDALAADAGE